MAVTETGTRAREPDSSGYTLTAEGLRLYYEVFGSGEKTIVMLPANPISHSRLWKAQVHYLARHFRVIAYDGRGRADSEADRKGLIPMSFGPPSCYIQHGADCSLR